MPIKLKLYRNKRTGEVKTIDPTFAPYLENWEELDTTPPVNLEKKNTRLDLKETGGKLFARKPRLNPDAAENDTIEKDGS